MKCWSFAVIVGVVAFWATLAGTDAAQAADLAKAIESIQAVGPKGQGNAAASRASLELSKAEVSQLTMILAGMDGAGPLATNWLRAAADAVAERTIKRGGPLPLDQLEEFLFTTKHSPRGRRLAYEWIVAVDKSAADRLIPKLLDDPSLELRRDAVARVITDAGKAKDDDKPQLYLKALTAARDLDQVKECTAALKKLGKPIDTATHLGFLTTWMLIGPFDNSDEKGFNIAYPPEAEVDFDATYEGKSGDVQWQSYTTDHEYGIVDLAKALDKHKGAIVYAAAEFISDQERKVDLRLGAINANKLWVNEKFISGNEVYHSGMNIDQYNETVALKKGKNIIVLKICQNEQEENWAQRWQFQLRVTDHLGGAVLSVGRLPVKAASLRRSQVQRR